MVKINRRIRHRHHSGDEHNEEEQPEGEPPGLGEPIDEKDRDQKSHHAGEHEA